jgi:hypothetical protein
MQDALLTPKRLANLSIMLPHSSSDDISIGTSSDGSGSSSPVVTPTAYDEDGAVALMMMGEEGGEHQQCQQEVYGHDGVQSIVGALVDDTVASLFGSNNSVARTVPVVKGRGGAMAMVGDGDMSTSPVDVLCCNGELGSRQLGEI